MSKLRLNLLRMLIILTMVLMMVYSDRGLALASPPYYLALVYLLFNLLAFLFAPREFYLSIVFHYFLIIVDIVVITLAIYLTSGFQSDFYLIYFLVIFVSSIGGNVKGSFYTAIIAAVLYAWIFSRGHFDSSLLESKFLIRLPFFLAFAFYTSFWASSVRKATEEKKQLEAFNIRLKEQVNTAVARFEDVSRFSENLMRSVRSGVIAIDNDTRIVLFNPHAETILNLDGKQLMHRSINDCNGLASISEVLRRTLNEHKEMHREELDIDVDGECKKLGFSTTILKDRNSSPVGCMILFTDLTNIFELREKLKRSEHLAHIGEMASWVAHEIRNPLSTIQGFSELIARQNDREKRDGYLKKIKEGTKRIDGIITDILYLSKEKPRGLEPVSLNQLLVIVAENIKALADFDVRFKSPSELIAVRGHRDRLTRVFENLIMNSIEAKASVVEVELKTNDKNAEVIIRDDGVGMDEEDKKKVFTPFYTTKQKGTGLGLAIVEKIIVEDHNGKIKCESEKGKGTTFRILLPTSGTEDVKGREEDG